jgi:hypothetical protein
MGDDITIACRALWRNVENTKRILTDDDWNPMLDSLSQWLGSGIAWGGCGTGGLPPAGRVYIDNTGTAEVFFFDGTQLPSAADLVWVLSTAVGSITQSTTFIKRLF